MNQPSLFEILKAALYVGTVGYGGPAILALMKRVIVHEKGWISAEEFMNALSLSQILPGATGVTLMGYIGHKLKGGWGGVLMPFAFAFPAMTAITILAWAYFSFGELQFVHAIFMGLGAMVVALLINATLMMGRSVFQGTDRNEFRGIAIAGLSFLAILTLRWDVVLVILGSGGLGALLFYRSGPVEEGKVPPQAGTAMDLPAAPSGWKNLLPPAALAAVLAVTFVLIDGTWTLFATFFKIGCFAFGGGFTAIPIIQSVVVDGMHWLDLRAFRDGIALGQITPGPVFITATFIGYKILGIIGAVVATIGIFTPSLMAIILLGRAHARIKNLRIVKAVIRGFLAGFIGLLLFVVLQFAVQSLVDWQTWVLFAVSVIYLLVWKKEILWLILGTIGVSPLVF
ncbi:MAG: chromate efflux transporter [Deltaproteobacteria bacterium]|nr:chromate efflux transporter [Deltaproteobacteria bacterium]